MTSGRDHDRATTIASLPLALLLMPIFGGGAAALGGLTFLIGGLWLSPDLDTHSRAFQRWGPLRPLWWPYQRLLRHRSLISHSPVLGSAGRLLYLAGLIAGLAWLLQPWGTPSPGELRSALARLWQDQRAMSLAMLCGLEASAWLHLIQDGDPVPRLPRLLRRQRRRPRRRTRQRR
ncbi:hypothetical protein SynRS9909_02753 [Synechococcus sp. RS9909]|uniref:metal-binding protein n=1 Tax=unclassified Synechococcus TaxID=2626047 RepID=UPI00006906B3|nr:MULTISPECIES: metal-binding protein [unclassified Synechococcus]EAQ70409.1 hypothetical protein RS9917_06220 [Synechococcus sp. RS9917]QNI80721.1 hypothetical protein SynRS9909_02753 [Synechococcus sp. RS9909]